MLCAVRADGAEITRMRLFLQRLLPINRRMLQDGPSLAGSNSSTALQADLHMAPDLQHHQHHVLQIVSTVELMLLVSCRMS
jgi:hypothetical protein